MIIWSVSTLFLRFASCKSNGIRFNLNAFFISALILFKPFFSPAQTTADSVIARDGGGKITIGRIIIEGNKRTREQIILRELTFTTGDSILQNDLMKHFNKSKNQLHNLGLFNEETINIKNWTNDTISVLVTVIERWYTIPLPAFNLYDRNFNVWWVEHNHDIKWIQFGGRFFQKNLTGRNDDLRAELLFGFQQRYSLEYNLPYFDNIQKHGLRVSASYSLSKNITYDLYNNKELIYEDVESYQRKSFGVSTDVFYKPGHHFKYTLSFGYRSSTIKDTIARLNPDYFLNGNTTQQYLFARMAFNMDYRDVVAYPLKGNYMDLSLAKFGFGVFDDVNIWHVNFIYNHFIPISKKWFISTQNKLKISFPQLQPYNLERGLGYGGDYVSGYEYYAIDGQSFGYSKFNIKNELFKVNIKTSAKNPFTNGAALPFSLFARVFADAGYVKDETYYQDNPLTNDFLFGTGMALDVVLFYDTSLRFEYSVNRLGEHALFYHFSTYF